VDKLLETLLRVVEACLSAEQKQKELMPSEAKVKTLQEKIKAVQGRSKAARHAMAGANTIRDADLER
jgi:hypothetical protein